MWLRMVPLTVALVVELSESPPALPSRLVAANRPRPFGTSRLEVIMIRNMGTADRTIRVVIGAAALLVSLVIGWGSVVGTVVGIALLVVATVMLVSAAVGYCPTYRLLHISTEPTVHRTSTTEAKVAAHH